MSDFILVSVDNWKGLYKDGKIIQENHSIDASELIEILRNETEINIVDSYFSDEDDLEKYGYRFPEFFKDLDLSTYH